MADNATVRRVAPCEEPWRAPLEMVEFFHLRFAPPRSEGRDVL